MDQMRTILTARSRFPRVLVSQLGLICAMWFGLSVTSSAQVTQTAGGNKTNMRHNETKSPLSWPVNRSPQDLGMDPERLEQGIGEAFAAAIAAHDVCGGVVAIVRDRTIVFQHAYGNRSLEPVKEAATIDTIYDMASLTKPIATGSAILKLMEQGKIRLNDPVKKFIPEWTDTSETKKLSTDTDQFWRCLLYTSDAADE